MKSETSSFRSNLKCGFGLRKRLSGLGVAGDGEQTPQRPHQSVEQVQTHTMRGKRGPGTLARWCTRAIDRLGTAVPRHSPRNSFCPNCTDSVSFLYRTRLGRGVGAGARGVGCPPRLHHFHSIVSATPRCGPRGEDGGVARARRGCVNRWTEHTKKDPQEETLKKKVCPGRCGAVSSKLAQTHGLIMHPSSHNHPPTLLTTTATTHSKGDGRTNGHAQSKRCRPSCRGAPRFLASSSPSHALLLGRCFLFPYGLGVHWPGLDRLPFHRPPSRAGPRDACLGGGDSLDEVAGSPGHAAHLFGTCVSPILLLLLLLLLTQRPKNSIGRLANRHVRPPFAGRMGGQAHPHGGRRRGFGAAGHLREGRKGRT